MMKKHIKKQLTLITLLPAILATPILGRADTQMADQYLQVAINELAAAKVYVQKAQAQAPKNQRVVFHYDWVLSDINRIEAGIAQKFSQPKIQPRVIKPIAGDYLGIVGSGKPT